MALTKTKLYSIELPNGLRRCIYNVVFDDSYPTGGEVFDVSAEFSGSPNVKWSVAADTTPLALIVKHNLGTAAAGTLLAYYQDCDAAGDSGLIEVGDTTDLALYSARVEVTGIGV